MGILNMFFHVDNLSLIIMGLVGFISLCVISFSTRYLDGDRHKGRLYINLVAMVCGVFLMVSADHILVLLISWAASNLFLTRLMLHKREWQAARQSSLLALKNFAIGFLFMAVALSLLYCSSGETSIAAIINSSQQRVEFKIGAVFLLLAAMTQSALWPFHRWLVSSLNSPTPVSAIMHAGLVNGGGFILARFAPLFLEQVWLLNIIFIIGIITALVGTLWKLMQHDVKRMLACSTMGQMGFMFAQCGLGLFPAAIAHLCWHGLFKAYLFLGSGSAAQEKRFDKAGHSPNLIQFILALICGGVGAYLFSLLSEKNIFAGDSTSFLIILAMVAMTQFALPILRSNLLTRLPLAFVITASVGIIYGLSVRLIQHALTPLDLFGPIPFNTLHFIALIMLIISWLVVLLGHQTLVKQSYPDWLLKIYVRILNASQPYSTTVTAHRNQYQF